MKYNLGDEYSEIFFVSSDTICRFAELSGDCNPIHINEAYARSTLFGRKIAHGILVGGYISKVIGMDFPGNGTIYLEQDLKFMKPVYADTQIEVCIRVEAVENFNKNIYRLSTKVFSEDGVCLVNGYAIVKSLT